MHVRSDHTKLKVSGELRKTYYGRGRIPGHLHIEVLSSDDELLIQTISRYRRLNGKSQLSCFSEKVEIQPDKVAKVRVIHHRHHEINS